jgi:hypothetical protein
VNNTFGNVADERRFCERLHELTQPGDLRWVEVAAARDAASDELQTVAQQRSGSLAQAGAWRDLDERARLLTGLLYVTGIGRDTFRRDACFQAVCGASRVDRGPLSALPRALTPAGRHRPLGDKRFCEMCPALWRHRPG